MANDIGTIRIKPAFQVCGISCRTSNSSPHQIGALWERYFQGNVREQVAHRLNDLIFAVYCEYESDHTGEYTLLLGHEVPIETEAPLGLTNKVVPAATYRVFEACGEQPGALIATWQRIWSSGLARTYTVDFDLHQSADIVSVHVAVASN